MVTIQITSTPSPQLIINLTRSETQFRITKIGDKFLGVRIDRFGDSSYMHSLDIKTALRIYIPFQK